MATGNQEPELAKATFSFGSFWGAEAAFRRVLADVRIGYMRGMHEPPSTETISTGGSECVEAVEIRYDPLQTRYESLLWEFMAAHDAAAWNTPSYGKTRNRSIIFFHSPEQEAAARDYIEEWQRTWRQPVRTEILPAGQFWPADIGHQRYFEQYGLGSWWRDSDQAPFASTDMPNHGTYLHARRRLEPLADLLGRTFGPTPDELDDPPVPADHQSLITPLSVALLHSEALVDATVAHVRRWVVDQPDAATRLRRCVVLADPIAGQSLLQVASATAEQTVAANLRPGYGRAWTQRPTRQRTVQWPRAAEDLHHNMHLPRYQSDDLEWGRPPLVRLDLGQQPTRQRQPGPTGQWYEHLPPTELTIGCDTSGPDHVAQWVDGDLHLDHLPVTSHDAERTMHALGAERCGCWLLVDLWDPRWIQQRWHLWAAASVVSLDKNVGAVSFGGRPSPWPELQTRLNRHSVPPLPPFDLADPDDEIRTVVRWRVTGEMHRLSLPLHVRWLLGAMAWLEAQTDTLDDADLTTLRMLFFDFVRPDVLHVLGQPLRFDESISTASFACRYLDPGETPRATADIDGGLIHVEVGIPFRWLTHVWARGLATIDDQLVLDVHGPRDAHELDVTVTTWRGLQPGEPPTLVTRETTARWDSDHWHLA